MYHRTTVYERNASDSTRYFVWLLKNGGQLIGMVIVWIAALINL
nr:MAG TPA: hypothetical protein [Caudoviricetes sp.]